MTCIVGIARDGRVYMAGDSCASDNYSWMHVLNPKVFLVQDRFLVGCTTSFRIIDLLRFSLQVDDQPSDVSDDAYIRTSFISAVRKLFKENGVTGDGKESGGNFLLGYRGRLYEIQTDFSVLNAPEWGHSVGSGESPARGSLHSTRDNWNCHTRLQLALDAAEATTPSVRGPFIFVDA